MIVEMEASQCHASDSPVPGECMDARTARPDGEYLELGVFHGRTLLPASCGLLVYKSYSRGARRTLYGEQWRRHWTKVPSLELEIKQELRLGMSQRT
jgi:hypothetical protein